MKIFKAISIVSLLFIGCGGGGGGDGYTPQDVAPYIKGWGSAELIETDNSGTAVNPRVAIDKSDNAIAVWQHNDGVRNNIWAKRYTAGFGWDTPEMIETDNSGSAHKPQITIDTNGNAIAVWQQDNGTTNNIWANRYVAGSVWGTAEQIETAQGLADDPQVSMDTSGNAIAVWQQFDGTTFTIWANRYGAGSGWGSAAVIGTDSGRADNPRIAIDTNGNAIAVWQQRINNEISIWTNRYTASSGWGTAELIETNNSGLSYNPQIAIDTTGNAIVVWYKNDSTEISIWANRYIFSSGWGTAELIEIESGRADDPQIAVDMNGNAIVVWKQYDGTKYNIWENRYTASGWGTAELIHSDSGTADSPRVAIDSNENAIVLWKQYNGINYNMWANRYNTASGWSTAERIETGNSGTASEPQVVMDTNGNAIAVWHKYDGERNNIWTNRFD